MGPYPPGQAPHAAVGVAAGVVGSKFPTGSGSTATAFLLPGAEYPRRVDDAEITLVTLRFEAADPERLIAILSKYVVLSRQQPGCRNIDLTASVTTPGRFVVVEKWESPEAQRAHFDSAEMVEMAEACGGILREPPEIDLLEGLSAHDLA